MTPDQIAWVQAGTAITAAATAFLNLGAIFFRRKVDPTQLQVIDKRAKEMADSNKRVTGLLQDVNTQMVSQLAAIDSKLSHVKAVVDRIK